MIPARYESSRFYGKPLAMINGKEMLIRVLERSTFKYEVYAVINNNLIGDVVRRNGFKYIMVKEDCKTGTDRIALALDKISINEDDILINVQGDEPMVSAWMIEKVIEMKKRFPDSVVNAFSSITSEKEFESKATIKMIINKNSDLLYASRSTIPSTKKTNNFYIPNPSDDSFETLNNFSKPCNVDVFFALSHGVHRGVLKSGKIDDRINFLKELYTITPDVKFDIYGIDKVQPIWADHYFKTISNAKMGLNLSRGDAIKYYSSDRITQIVGNGLVCLIDEKTQYRDFFNNSEMVFYKNVSDLSEKILKISRDEKLRKKIAKNGKKKYMKYFNSSLVAEFIINKTLGIDNKKKFFWHN